MLIAPCCSVRSQRPGLSPAVGVGNRFNVMPAASERADLHPGWSGRVRAAPWLALRETLMKPIEGVEFAQQLWH